VILLLRTIVIFFWDGHGFILKRSILINIPFVWGMRDRNEVEIYDTKTSQEGSTYVEGENRKRKNWKRRNIISRRKGNWRKRKESKDKDDGKGSREIRCFIEGHPCSVAFVYERDNNVVSKDWWRNSSYQQAFIRVKQGSNSVQDNVWKNYYVILLPRTLVIFFWDGHCFILKRSILINVPFVWGMRDMKWSWNLWHQDKPVRINIGWRRK